MRCDRCREVAELTPVTLGTLNEGGQFDGYVDDACTTDLCVSCVDEIAAAWNRLCEFVGGDKVRR